MNNLQALLLIALVLLLSVASTKSVRCYKIFDTPFDKNKPVPSEAQIGRNCKACYAEMTKIRNGDEITYASHCFARGTHLDRYNCTEKARNYPLISMELVKCTLSDEELCNHPFRITNWIFEHPKFDWINKWILQRTNVASKVGVGLTANPKITAFAAFAAVAAQWRGSAEAR